MISIIDDMTSDTEILMIDNEYSLEKKVIKLIYINPQMTLYITVNQVNLCDYCVCVS